MILFQAITASSQSRILDVGVRLQKSINLYNENGVSLAYSHPSFANDKLYFGFAFVTSRLGSAMGTNAIKQDNYILSAGYFGRKDKIIRPFARLNTGWFYANYEYEIFKELDHVSLILAPDFGLSIETPYPLKAQFSFGYNLITGDGTSGPGTLYPLFIQSTISWNIFEK